MQRRLQRIVSIATTRDSITITHDVISSTANVKKAIEFILKSYRIEIEQSFAATDDLKQTPLLHIMQTIEKLIRLDGENKLTG